MPIKSKEQVEREFDEKFIRDDGLMNKYAYDADGETTFTGDAVKFFISSLRHDLLQGLLEEVEKRNKDITAIEYAENINPEEYRMMYHEQTLRLGYNQALSDISSRLRELLKE